MEANPNDPNDTPLDFYMDVPFSSYLNPMGIDGTFDDEINLRAADELLKIKPVIIATLSKAAEATISPKNLAPQGSVYLGQFVENHRKHYVFLFIQLKIPISNECFDYELKKTTYKSILYPVEILMNQVNLPISK